MVQEDSPGVQTHTKAVNAWLLEGILVEQIQELQHGKERIKFNSLQVRGYKPIEEVRAFSEKSSNGDEGEGETRIIT